MRICSVVTSFTSGGAEVLVGNLSRAYRRSGHQALVVALAHAAQLGNDPETERRMIHTLQSEGVITASLGLGRQRGVLAGARALGRVARGFGADVIHAHTARAVLMLSLAQQRAPILFTHHNSRLSFPPKLFRLFDLTVHGYIAISEQCAQQTKRYAQRPTRLILNAADPVFRAGGPRSEPAIHPTILAVGTISDQKDYPTLVRAAERLRLQLADQHRVPRIRIAGGGALFAQLQALIDREGRSGTVELLGVRSDIAELMMGADLFVNCSRYEGLPVAMIEAAMSALPIVATDVPGNREIVRPGRNGLLVPAADPDALADAMAAALRSPEEYRTYSQGALDEGARFSIEACESDHLSFYEEAITSREMRRAA